MATGARELATAERAELGGLLEVLTGEQWDAPSLCAGWTVRALVGHLISFDELTPRRVPAAVWTFAMSRCSPDRFNRNWAGRWSASNPKDLVDLYRAHIADRSGVAKLLPHENMLAEALIHHQDIRRPLGLARNIPRERLATVLEFIHRDRGGTGGRKHAHGLRLVATDIEWSAGTGPEVAGPAESLIMALAGRRIALAEVEGDGTDVLAGRIRH